ncbi:YkgJ family cysteine cluster protein [Geomonas sp.]|uniref:YkgJ family cysteine cluster protein n=1 Tax=Geomonas sp. TaxID=2651584 RepID=UPI002B483673|nr:YkgJ family cysteine cluster protein [Geomonas sp.]HJV34170.1 YkgJ family cysteine cluster protein [Geomonas sp.]
MPGLENYLALVGRVDELCARSVAGFAEHIVCKAGCDACCRHLSIFAVEAAALREALAALPAAEADAIREKALAAPEGRCPLLHDGLCLLYQARPIICRTHGLPLLISREGEKSVDFCPDNFRGLTSIPGSAVIDLERLNEMLAAINALYLQSHPGPERLTVAETINPKGLI